MSIATASTVLSEAPGARIALSTRARVRDAARELGYVPRRRRATSVLAVHVGPALDGFTGSVLAGIVAAAVARGHLLVLLAGDEYRAPTQVESVIAGVIRVEGAAPGDRPALAADSGEWRTVLVSTRTATEPRESSGLVVVRPDVELEVDALERLGAPVGCLACAAPEGAVDADCPHAGSRRLGSAAVELILDDDEWERAVTGRRPLTRGAGAAPTVPSPPADAVR